MKCRKETEEAQKQNSAFAHLAVSSAATGLEVYASEAARSEARFFCRGASPPWSAA
jgi:hypothetical protein